MANYPNAVTGFYWKVKQNTQSGVRYILVSCVKESRVKYPELGFNFSAQVPINTTGKFLCFLSKEDADKFIAKYLDSSCVAFRSRNTNDVIYRIDNGNSIVPCYSGWIAISNANYAKNEPNYSGYSPRYISVVSSPAVENPFEANSDETLKRKEKIANSRRVFDGYKKVFTKLAGFAKAGKNCYGEDSIEASLPVPGMNYPLHLYVSMNNDNGVMRISASESDYVLSNGISVGYGENINDHPHPGDKFSFTPASRDIHISDSVDDKNVLAYYTNNKMLILRSSYFFEHYKPAIFKINLKDDDAKIKQRVISELNTFSAIASSIVSQLKDYYGYEQLTKDMF